MSNERAIEAVQHKQPQRADSPQVGIGSYEPHQLGELSKHGRLYVLADGVSGAASGYTVSQYAVGAVLHSYFIAGPADLFDPKARLLTAIKQTNVDIYERNLAHPERRILGTALIAALIHNDKLVVANIGDSRVYVVWDQDIERLNKDIALADETNKIIGAAAAQPLIPAKTEQVDESQAKSLDPASSQQIFPRGLGLDEDVKIDTFSRRLFAGDTVILCSGGLTGYVSEPEIARAISQHGLDEAARRLMDLARERGGHDDLAISIAQVLSSPVNLQPPPFRPLPLKPTWSDWDVPPQPGSKTPTKPSSKPVVLPTAAKPDAAAEARLRLTQARFQPIDGRPLFRWPGCGVAALVLLLVCAILVVAWQFLIPAEMVAAVPFLGDGDPAAVAGVEPTEADNTNASGSAGAQASGPVLSPTVPTTAAEETGSPDGAVTLVAESNSPVSAPDSTFNSPVGTPIVGGSNMGDAITIPTSTPGTPTPTPPPLPTIEVPANCTNKARFRRDMTVPDGTQFAPGEAFEKVWLLQNAGTCPWGPGYTARHIGGNQMGVSGDTPLVERVSPDTNGEITVAMVAPNLPGEFRGDWQLYDLNDEPFGPEMYLEIEVLPVDPTDLDESDATVLYDFIDRASEATWSSGGAAYTLLQTDIDETLPLPAGDAMVATGPALLRGNVNSDGNVLLTYPHRELGMVEGRYAVDTPLQPTDVLAATLGYLKLSILPDDGVTYEVSFTPTGRTEQLILSETVQYRDSPLTVLQPLTGIEPGQTGIFTVRVLGGDRLSQDWATWIELSLIRQTR